MKKIAVLTSGGDSPGMNACIRAVVRTAIYHQINVVGIKRGYDGLIEGDFIALESKSVSNIMQRGGTMLKTARSKRFITKEGMQEAYYNLKKHDVEGLVVIGGDGTFKGAEEFGNLFNFPVMGCAGTIDNDLIGTDYTIGYDTAINTVVEAVDKIRDTAESHDRLFIVEVMGRDAGLIALRSGIGVGAEAILIPETKRDVNTMLERLERGRKDKSSKIIIVAEGEEAGGAFEIAEIIKKKFNQIYDIRVSILGHMQRGGSPSCMDRVLASRVGFAAVEALLGGRKGEMVGIINKDIAYTPFAQAVKHIEDLNPQLLRMVDILSL
ncbi:MAG TPA: 6-phosphofructokinase [Bacteroidia bacterium]|nr:6-phosphofructokinase [Bacteroidia bacterium]